MDYLNPYIEVCLEGSSSVFKGLNQKDKETLIRQHTLTILKKGQLLFKQGEKPCGLICLASGKAKVYKEGVGGRSQILKMVRQQGFIGYNTLFSDIPWSVSAIALEDSAICVFEKNSFLKILKKNPDYRAWHSLNLFGRDGHGHPVHHGYLRSRNHHDRPRSQRRVRRAERAVGYQPQL